MKKSLRKAIMTLAAVSALSMAMCASAMAANIENANVTTSAIEDGKATVTYTGKAAAGEEVTVLLLKPDANEEDGIQESEIAYIDQKTAGADGAFEFSMPITGVEEGNKFKLKSASASSDEVTKGDANFGGGADVAGILGDVNNADGVNVTDAGLIVKFIANGALEAEGTQDLVAGKAAWVRADINKADGVNVTDAGLIVKFIANGALEAEGTQNVGKTVDMNGDIVESAN